MKTVLKRIPKLFFLSFFFFTCFILMILPNSAKADVNYTPTIEADWLYVDTGTFVDTSPNSWETNVKIADGGVDLWDFQNLGIISYSDTEVLYKAKTTFGFEVTMHTDVDYGSVYPNINRDKEHTEPFFRIARKWNFKITNEWFDVSWNSIELGYMRQHNYDGKIPITVGIRDILGNSGTITLNGQTFDTPTYIADVVRTRVTDVRSGNVGGYKDIFTNINDVSNGSVSFQKFDDDFSAAQSAIIAFYANSDLGWSAGTIEESEILQQSMIGPSQKGVEFHNPPISDSYTFRLSARIQPEVSKYSQYNDIRGAEIKYYMEDIGVWPVIIKKGGTITTLVSPHTYTAPERIVAIHTTNKFIHWDFEVDVEFVATVDSTAELTQAILDDPYLKAGDMIWDVGFTGDYKVDIPLPIQDTWLDNLFGDLFDFLGGALNFIILIVIVGVGLYVFVKIGVPLIRKRALRDNPRRSGY